MLVIYRCEHHKMECNAMNVELSVGDGYGCVP